MKNDDIDKLIDDSLATYSASEFPPGLEQRVLNRVRAVSSKPRFSIWRWAPVIPVLAALFLAVAIGRIYYMEVPDPPRIVWRGPEIPVISRAKAEPARPTRVQRVNRQSKPQLPKQQTFPAPAPMTDEERAMVAFVQEAPEHAYRMLAEIAKDSFEPMRIEDIQIPPLDSSSSQ